MAHAALIRRLEDFDFAVGAGAKRDKPALGRTVGDLAPGQWDQIIVDPVQDIAERLLADGVSSLSNPVGDARS